MTASPPHFDRAWHRRFERALRPWFAAAARDLPWRQHRDLYGIWISEIMLQQTQVATVIAYYRRFLAAFPNVVALAEAPEEDVLKLWEGLGYYRRARQLHAAAKQIAREHQGRFPDTFDAVRALPGIGRYTAGAILSIGLDLPLPILEANTVRLFSRLTAFRGDPAAGASQAFLWRFAEEILPSGEVGAFNQALMELGSLVCKPRDPDCPNCPAAALCRTRELGLQNEIPAPKRKPRMEDVTHAAVVIRRGKKILLRRCGPEERWAGLWDFPRFETPAEQETEIVASLVRQTQSRTGYRIANVRPLAVFKHGVTRFRITLRCFSAEHAGGRGKADEEAAWIEPASLGEYPLSVTGRKIAGLLATA